jgi:catechol 2,3-dioxygenase-like lactoylglutathione lyase family enzyme
MAIDHVSVGVTNMARAKAFYDAALKPLGLEPIMPVQFSGQLVGVGYGQGRQPRFWIQLPINGSPASAGNGVHVAFTAPDRAAVDAFYLAAVEHGGVEDGAPGLRTEYHPD